MRNASLPIRPESKRAFWLARSRSVRDAGLDVRQGLRLIDVRLDLGQHVADLHDRALPDPQPDDPAGHRRLDVYLGDRIDHPDLADGDLEVLGLDLSQPEGELFGPLGLVLAAHGDDGTAGDQHSEHSQQDPAFLSFGHNSLIRSRMPRTPDGPPARNLPLRYATEDRMFPIGYRLASVESLEPWR
jgi:hypothetical protein